MSALDEWNIHPTSAYNSGFLWEALLPRFYFHLFNDEIMFDDVGQDFTDPGAARDGAIRGISELIAEHLAQGKAVDLAHRIDVADESGDVVQKIRFGDLFTYRGERLDLGPPQ